MQAQSMQTSKQLIWCTDCKSSHTGHAGSGFTESDICHRLIISLIKCSNTSRTENIDFEKCLEKYAAAKWFHSGKVPVKKGKFKFPLVHWACVLGKYLILEYLVTEKGFDLSVKVGRHKEGPLHSMVRHLRTGLNAQIPADYILRNAFCNILDVFLRYMPEAFSEKDVKTHDTILHFLARRCNMDPCSRIYLKILLAKIKESSELSAQTKDEVLSAANKKGNTFLHLLVSDESSARTVTYLCDNFGSTAQRISKTWNNLHKTPRQIAVEKRCFAMLRALGAPAVVLNSLSRGSITWKEE
ncbi:uncharacterized protein [Montipora capricornis]|uniref:uncharacterized protein isoform X1 n=1 Tax=Montipora capricornis TaxID=246305 RepID=UPI0035F203DD